MNVGIAYDMLVYAGQYDPTRTTVLRNNMVRKSNAKFDALALLVRRAVDTEDVFGLRPLVVQQETPGKQAYTFMTNPQKISEFLKWLQEQIDNGILVVDQFGERWTDMYILDSYKRGLARARLEMIRAGYDIPSVEQTGGIDFAMQAPLHVERVSTLFTRAFNELKGITDAMEALISRILAQSFIDGDNPRVIARKLVAAINGTGLGDLAIKDSLGRFIPAKRRAEILARTEIIRAHHLAAIAEYRSWAADEVYVKAEFVTAGDDRVCSQCAAIEAEGKLYTLDEIEPLIPVHPQCRCIALPKVINANYPKDE